jgi:hypothetical protein
MIASQGDKCGTPPVGNEPVENSAGLWAAIDVVSQCDNYIIGLKWNEGGKRRERSEAAMDITYHEMSHTAPFFAER